MIELKDITFKQKEKIIFHNFNLHINPKERVVIVGRSGSGKSTLLRLIAGFTAPDSGEIFIDKKLVSKDGEILIPPHKREIGMIFQDLALWNHLSVAGNIEFGLKINKVEREVRKEKIAKILQMVGLKKYDNRAIETLSGGEQQRVALARSLVLSPKILLMDEPLSSLDKKLNQHLRKEIVLLQKELRFTLVYVTHNEEEAREVGTRVVEIES